MLYIAMQTLLAAGLLIGAYGVIDAIRNAK